MARKLQIAFTLNREADVYRTPCNSKQSVIALGAKSGSADGDYAALKINKRVMVS